MSKSRHEENHRVEGDDEDWPGYNPTSFSSFYSSPIEPSRQSRESSSDSWLEDTLATEVEAPNEEHLTSQLIPPLPEHLLPISKSSRTQRSSPGKTGAGVKTPFLDHSIWSNNSASSRGATRYQRDRSEVQFKGTGPHDDFLARSREVYRELPFRESNKTIVAPEVEMKQRKNNNGNSDTRGAWFTKVSLQHTSSSKHKQTSKKHPTPSTSNVIQSTNQETAVNTSEKPQKTHEFESHDTEQASSINDVEKVVVLRKLVQHKDEYINLPTHANERGFWVMIFQELRPELKEKFAAHDFLKAHVSKWTNRRREKLLQSIPDPVREGYEELDSAIDAWMRVWCQRFTKKHWGYFNTAIWEVAQETLIAHVRQEVPNALKAMLRERERELARMTRPPVLHMNSNIEDYRKYMKQLQERIPEGSKSSHVSQTEALLSLVLDLTPGLETILCEMKHKGIAINDCNPATDQLEDTNIVMHDAETDSSDCSSEDQGGGDEETRGEDGNGDDAVAADYHSQASPVLGESSSQSQTRDDDIRPSIEADTPETTPRTLGHLQSYEQAYCRALVAAKVGDSLPSHNTSANSSLKRKPAERFEAKTPKRTRIEDEDEPPLSAASTFSFPSVSKLVISRNSEKAKQSEQKKVQEGDALPVGDTISPVCQTPTRLPIRSKTRVSQSLGAAYTPTPQERGSASSLRTTQATRENPFATPHPKKQGKSRENPSGRGGTSGSRSAMKIAVSKPSGTISIADDSDEDIAPRHFRESTADFTAMTPSSREAMLFRAVKAIYRKKEYR